MEKTMSAFENALLDKALRSFDYIPTAEEIDHEFSPEFERKSEKLIKKSGSNVWHCVNTTAKRLLIAAIIAALLTGTVLAVPALREGLIRMFVHDNGSMYYFSVDRNMIENAPTEIETAYSLTYIPDGYKLVNTVAAREGIVSLDYMDENEGLISFDQELVTQDPRNKLGGMADSERSKLEHVELNGYKVVQIIHEDGEVEFLWTDNEYFFSLFCDKGGLDEAKRVFYGIKPDAGLTQRIANGEIIMEGKYVIDLDDLD